MVAYPATKNEVEIRMKNSGYRKPGITANKQ